MRKIAYISSPHFADCDLPLLRHLQSEADTTYILYISDRSKQLTLVNVSKIKKRGGIYPASSFPGLTNLARYINLRKTYVVNMPGRHDLSPSNLVAMWRLVLFLIKGRFELIHLTWPPRYGQFFIYLLRRKIVMTMHDPLPHSSEDTPLSRFHRRTCFAMVNNFILLNATQKDEFIAKYNLIHKNIFLSQLSVYVHLQDTTPQDVGRNGYVLFFGSINAHKGIDILCKAMSIVNTEHNDLKLVIAGKGRIYFDIEPYVAAGYIDLRNHYLSDGELAGLIRQSAFVVCPYIDATQSGVVMSAFALGKPVIATNVGGLPEMVNNGRHGLIVPPRDAAALAVAICRLVEDTMLLKRMSDNIVTDYGRGANSWAAIAKGMTAIYDTILSEKRKN